MRNDISIRPETAVDRKGIIRLVLDSFSRGTNYSDGTDVVALIEEIRESAFYIPSMSYVAEKGEEIVGHFMFSRFPLSATKNGGHPNADGAEIVMLAPVSVRCDLLREGIGTAMLTAGIEAVRQTSFRGITVEGNFRFYNTLGFRTSSEFGIFPVSGWPLDEPRCMMAMETRPGSLAGIRGFVKYDMYINA